MAGAVHQPATVLSSGGVGRWGGRPRTSGWLGGLGGRGGGSAVRSGECTCGRRLSALGTGSVAAGASSLSVSLVVWVLLGWWQVGAIRLHLRMVRLKPACSLSPMQELGLIGSCRR
jgi:hypothetical protein